MNAVAAWCFVCDAPVDTDRCPTCGRPPVVVEEDAPVPPPSRRRVSRRVWIWLIVVGVVVLFSLLQSGFRLGEG